VFPASRRHFDLDLCAEERGVAAIVAGARHLPDMEKAGDVNRDPALARGGSRERHGVESLGFSKVDIGSMPVPLQKMQQVAAVKKRNRLILCELVGIRPESRGCNEDSFVRSLVKHGSV
jgi:hypothetical protein